MHSSYFRRAFPKLILILAVAIVGVFLSRGGDNNVSAAGNYNAATILALTSSATGASADSQYTFTQGPGTMNFSNVATLTAPGACIANERDGVDCAGGARPIIGDVVGTLSSATTLGLTNNPCGPSTLPVSFVFLNASTDNSIPNLVNGSNQWEADSGGIQSPFLHDVYTIATDNDPALPNTVGAAQFGSDSTPGAANGLPTHVDHYMAFLNIIFDPDFSGTVDGFGNLEAFSAPFDGADPLQPMARYSGAQIVAGTSVTLTFLVFAPGDLNGFNAPHPLADLDDTSLGYVSSSILQDTTRAAVPGSITDFCSPLTVTTTTFGFAQLNPCNGVTIPPCNVDGTINNPTPGAATARVRYQNPTVIGTHYNGGFHQSLRDLDGEGLENDVDTCVYTDNVDLWPTAPDFSSGPDTDMLDSSCDPTDGGANTNPDSDAGVNGTNWLNAGDNCPQNANPGNEQGETFASYANARPRGGSQADGIGNACDIAETLCADALDNDVQFTADNQTGPDGLVNDGCAVSGGAVAEATCTFTTAAEMDNDLDGYPNDGCAAVGPAESGADCEDFQQDDDDNADTVINNSDNLNDGCPAQGGAEFGCLNSTDDDGDTLVNDGCPSSASVANGHFHTTWSLLPKCIGGTDGDSDGYCNAATTQAGVAADPNDGAAGTIPETYSQVRIFPIASAGSGNNPPASSEPLQICNDTVDNDGDGVTDSDDDSVFSGTTTTDDCRPPDTVFTGADDDTDGDGAKDTIEVLIGTDALSRCGRGNDASGVVPNSSFPMDMRGEAAFGADKVNVQDLGTYTSPVRRLNTAPGAAAYNRRWDLRPGNNSAGSWITVADLAVVSTQVAPPMYGIRAFGLASVCSAHKVLDD